MTRPLSAAQIQALQMAANGMLVKTVAHELGISVEAAKTRRRDAVRKLKAQTTPQAVALAIGRGLISHDPVGAAVARSG